MNDLNFDNLPISSNIDKENYLGMWGIPKKDKEHPCTNCKNNPKNNPHASGICNCALPALHNPIT